MIFFEMAREEPEMLLDRIDIESHGPLKRVALGPFSQTLNAIVAASGSGKTALVRFLRDSLTGTTPAREGLAESCGRVVWSAADGYYHCRRTPNGTAQGHRFVELETRAAGGTSRPRFAREAIVVDLPACVVDGIVTDTMLTSVQHCVQAAIASGLDPSAIGLEPTRDAEINELRREIDDLERQIHASTLHSQHASARHHHAYESYGLTLDMKRLRDRRAELSLEISAIDARRDWSAKADAEMDRRRRKRDLFATIADEIERLHRREAELKMRLADVESQLEQMDEEAGRAARRSMIAKAYRRRLAQIDTQIVQVRNVVREVRAMGDHWFGGRGVTAQAGWLEQAIDDVARVTDRFLPDTSADRFGTGDQRRETDIADRGWSAALANPEGTEPADWVSTIDVQRRIDAICRLVDNLVGRYEEHQAESATSRGYDARMVSTSDSQSGWASGSDLSMDGTDLGHSSDPGSTKSDDSSDVAERFDPTSNLDRAERLLQEERLYQAGSPEHSNEDVAWIAAVLNGVSQRLRGLAGRHAAYGSSNLDPLFHARRDDSSFSDISNYGSALDPTAQVAAVRRCERELVEVLRRLGARRDVMLRRVAELQNQPLSQIATPLSESPSSDDDQQLYQWMVRDRITASQSAAKQRAGARQRLTQQRAGLATDLKRTLSRTTDRVAEAETIRMHLRSLPIVHRDDDDSVLRSRLVAEIRSIDEQLSRPQIHPSILQRHAQCVTRLQSLTSHGPQLSGLSAAASDHLRKLSGGRLSSVTWRRGVDSSMHSWVEIDDRNESSCSSPGRFLAAIAVRLAAADELAKRGRTLPVIIETPSLRHTIGAGSNRELRSMLQLGIDALAESARRGRQIVILTDDAVIADSIMRTGGSVHSMRSSGRLTQDSPNECSDSPRAEQMFDVNRDFDLAWAESGSKDTPWRGDDRPASDVSVNDDGSSAGNATSIQPPRSRFDAPAHDASPSPLPWSEATQAAAATHTDGRLEAAEVPFFLAGHSPVEQAPSIEIGHTERLHAIGVASIEDLLAASPKELAGSLGLDRVDAATVRRWQHECRLVCGVRKLRGFDARVLVGCGITHPRELAEIDSKTLVERVEAFMATDRGGRILRSGTDQEISRLTDWINQAKAQATGHSSKPTHVAADLTPSSGSRYAAVRREHQQRLETQHTSERLPAREFEATKGQAAVGKSTSQVRPLAREPELGNASAKGGRQSRNGRVEKATTRFYLQRSSDVEAAPSIGPRMAERMRRIDIGTVDDLLSRPASSIAAELKLAKVDAGLVRQWQQEAMLVCQVPMLRGHDAQLLVAAGISEPERLAECDARWLLAQIEPIAEGREGKSILRGNKHPDLAEVRAWINNAQHYREMVAA